jgi:carbon storage regulator
MLVLSRRCEESLIIDGQIKVTVLQISGREIRLGIEAPREVSILREELVTEPIRPRSPCLVPGP